MPQTSLNPFITTTQKVLEGQHILWQENRGRTHLTKDLCCIGTSLSTLKSEAIEEQEKTSKVGSRSMFYEVKNCNLSVHPFTHLSIEYVDTYQLSNIVLGSGESSRE